MNDAEKELLSKAAKAAGVRYDPAASKPHPKSGAFWGLWLLFDGEPSEYARRYWNPITDDGDALRLGAKLNTNIEWREDSVLVGVEGYPCSYMREYLAEHKQDPCAAIRRAIVRAAAAMGERHE